MLLDKVVKEKDALKIHIPSQSAASMTGELPLGPEEESPLLQPQGRNCGKLQNIMLRLAKLQHRLNSQPGRVLLLN